MATKNNSTSTNSLWAERHAFKKQAELLIRLVRSGFLNNLETARMLIQIIDLAELTYNYRNGRGFSNHVKEYFARSHGTPLKDQTLHNEDFEFGY